MKQRRFSRILPWAATTVLLLGGFSATAQQPGGDAPPPPPRMDDGGRMSSHRPPMERAFRMGPPGRWWDNLDMAQKIGLSSDQQKKMDDIFQESRLKLIDQHAVVEKEETILEPLLSADPPDESRILAQIDKVAQSRAELEKSNARMLLGLRRVLTSAQWKTLQTIAPPPPTDDRGHRDHDRGRGRRGGPDAGAPPPTGVAPPPSSGTTAPPPPGELE